MSRPLFYGGLLAALGLCWWAQYMSWRRGEDRLASIERRLTDIERNWKLDDALLERAEEVIGRIEGRLAQPQWTPLPNLPLPTNGIVQPFYWQSNIVITNAAILMGLAVTQDAAGNWTVRWPTNRADAKPSAPEP